MDNKPSSTSGGKGQSFVQQNRNPLIIAAIVIILLVIYFATRGNTETGQQDQNSNQEMSQNSNTSSEGDQGNKPAEGSAMKDTSKPATPTSATSGEAMTGNLTVTGKLSATDNTSKGNYMVASDKGMVYVNTQRDFSSLVGQNVTLTADGTMTAFTLMDIKATGDVKGATDTTAKGGDTETAPAPATKPEEMGEVKFSGKLDKSTDPAKGTYTITSGKTVVYLQSSRDYYAWVGSDVDLTAKGTIKDFSGATLAKK